MVVRETLDVGRNLKISDFLVHCKDPHDLYIGRPSKWANPFSSKPGSLAKFIVENRSQALYQYCIWFFQQTELILEAQRELPGLVLACWCGNKKRCHGELLVAIANELILPDYVGSLAIPSLITNRQIDNGREDDKLKYRGLFDG